MPDTRIPTEAERHLYMVRRYAEGYRDQIAHSPVGDISATTALGDLLRFIDSLEPGSEPVES